MVDKNGPNRIRVLKLDPKTRLTLDVALANNKIPAHETTSSMAARHHAIAAINGDYTLVPSDPGAGRPIDLFAEDGNLVTSPLIWGRNFSLSADETTPHIGHAPLSVTIAKKDGTVLEVPSWNEQNPKPSALAGYTPAGGSTFAPPSSGCEVRLLPRTKRSWAQGKLGVKRSYTVDAARCSSSGGLARKNGVVIAAKTRTTAADGLMSALLPGDQVSLTWSMGVADVLDTVGGNPSLLEDGVVTVGSCSGSYFCDRNPRTGIGYTSTGKILMVTVDGRQDSSVGMTLMEFTRLFQRLGAVSALNLDGGGSTTMWVKGKLVNKPAQDPERPVGSSILVLPGPDRGETAPLPYKASLTGSVAPRSLTPTSDAGSMAPCLGLRDPGSTGGFLDAMASGALGPHQQLSSTLRDAVDVFRGRSTCSAFRRATRS
jgi:hypothetical protein